MFVGWVSACHHPAIRQRDILPLPHHGQRGRHSTLCQVLKTAQAFLAVLRIRMNPLHFGKLDPIQYEKPHPGPPVVI